MTGFNIYTGYGTTRDEATVAACAKADAAVANCGGELIEWGIEEVYQTSARRVVVRVSYRWAYPPEPAIPDNGRWQ